MRVSHTIHLHHLCRQVPGEEVQMWGKLYWVNDTATTFQHNWHIHTTAVSWEQGVVRGEGCWGEGVGGGRVLQGGGEGAASGGGCWGGEGVASGGGCWGGGEGVVSGGGCCEWGEGVGKGGGEGVVSGGGCCEWGRVL